MEAELAEEMEFHRAMLSGSGPPRGMGQRDVRPGRGSRGLDLAVAGEPLAGPAYGMRSYAASNPASRW